jgi:hypothetical protein
LCVSSAAPLLVLLLAPIAQSAAVAATLFRESTRTDLPTTGKGFGATWVDIDGYGRLDLMLNHNGRGRGALWARLDNYRYPELVVLNYRTPARLFRYDGRRWNDRSPDLNPYLAPSSPRRAWCENVGLWFSVGAAGDLDRDGHTDLVLAGVGHFLFHNNGTGGLVDVAGAVGLPEKVRILVDIVLGDVDNDGDLDLLYVFRWMGGVQLWLNESTPGHLKFREGPSLAHLPLQPELDSALLADFDNDGVLDLYVVMQDGQGGNTPNLMARGTGDGNFNDFSMAWGSPGAAAACPCSTRTPL